MRAVTDTLSTRDVLSGTNDLHFRGQAALAVYAEMLKYWGHGALEQAAREACKAADALVKELRRTEEAA